MAAPARALLALAAAALLHCAFAEVAEPRELGDSCQTEIRGNINGRSELHSARINAGERRKRIDVEPIDPYRCHLVGIIVTACDDVAPKIQVPKWSPFSPVVITRRGDLDKPIIVSLDLHCL